MKASYQDGYADGFGFAKLLDEKQISSLTAELAKVRAERDAKETELATSVMMMAKIMLERDSLREQVRNLVRRWA